MEPEPARDKLLSITPAAQILGIGKTTLHRYSEDGKVPYIELPSGHRRYRESVIRKLAQDWGVAQRD